MPTSSIPPTASVSSKRTSSEDQQDTPWAFYFMMSMIGLGILFFLAMVLFA